MSRILKQIVNFFLDEIYCIMLKDSFDLNILAITVAKVIADGATKEEISDTIQLLSLIQNALKSYIR